ncbi:MAG: YjgN family protein, partial [Gammaproteobacteria bacterium]|nr:YjgN family protein [Gammaproteobacteria bacterium]
QGGEYFRIWIVNAILTVVTLGIYSAWAKVRRLQYFYRHTRLGDASFDYHGTPQAILKGRLIGFGLFALYSVALKIAPLIGLFIGLVLALVMPFLLVMSLRFRLHNSSYRGLRFAFTGSIKKGYFNFLLLPVLTVFTLYLLAPFTHQRIKAFQHNHSRFGTTNFSFNASVGGFYKIYFVAFFIPLIALIAMIVMMVSAIVQGGEAEAQKGPPFMLILAMEGIFVLIYLVVVPYFFARIQNIVWNNTQLGAHRFKSDVTARGLWWIMFSNFIGIVLTLGLYMPYASIRLARYRLEHMALMVDGSLQSFVAGVETNANATGEETAGMFDVDIGL